MIELPVYLFVILCTVIVLLLYISFIQYQRADKTSQIANVLLSNMKTIYDFITEATEKMGNPQLKQAFEADDEVGFFFKELESIQETLSTFVPHEETSTDEQ